jgi:hypothetical protein
VSLASAVLFVHASLLRVADGKVKPEKFGLKGIGTRKLVANLVPASDEPFRALQQHEGAGGI